MTILEDVYWSMEMEDGMTQTVAENSRMSVKYHQVIVISFKPSMEVRKTARIRNQCNQVPHLSQDIKWESDKLTVRHHKREPRGQPFPSRLPQGTNNQTHTNT